MVHDDAADLISPSAQRHRPEAATDVLSRRHVNPRAKDVRANDQPLNGLPVNLILNQASDETRALAVPHENHTAAAEMRRHAQLGRQVLNAFQI